MSNRPRFSLGMILPPAFEHDDVRRGDAFKSATATLSEGLDVYQG